MSGECNRWDPAPLADPWSTKKLQPLVNVPCEPMLISVTWMVQLSLIIKIHWLSILQCRHILDSSIQEGLNGRENNIPSNSEISSQTSSNLAAIINTPWNIQKPSSIQFTRSVCGFILPQLSGRNNTNTFRVKSLSTQHQRFQA